MRQTSFYKRLAIIVGFGYCTFAPHAHGQDPIPTKDPEPTYQTSEDWNKIHLLPLPERIAKLRQLLDSPQEHIATQAAVSLIQLNARDLVKPITAHFTTWSADGIGPILRKL